MRPLYLSRAINCPRNNAIYPKTNPIPNPGGMNPKKASIAFHKMSLQVLLTICSILCRIFPFQKTCWQE